MKYLKILLILLLTLSFVACPFKKKKEIPPWVTYQKNAETALESLKVLQEQEFGENDLTSYKTNLQKTKVKIDQFLQTNKTNPPRTSYLEIESALQDFQLALELIERKYSTTDNNFFTNKLFANTDAELFAKVKQRYNLGPELQTASHNYYYIDPIVHEALRSANSHIDRANRKLKDEVSAEAKAAKAKPSENVSGKRLDSSNTTPSPTPTPGQSPDKKPKNP